MTIHPDIHRALAQHGGNLQDAYRIAWMAGIPPQFRRVGTAGSTVQRSPLERGTETTQARAAAIRAELAKVILPLHEAGATIPKIAQTVQRAHATVRRVLDEHGLTPNVSTSGSFKDRDYTGHVASALELRSQGKSWREVGKTLGVCRDRIRKACDEWEARQ